MIDYNKKYTFTSKGIKLQKGREYTIEKMWSGDPYAEQPTITFEMMLDLGWEIEVIVTERRMMKNKQFDERSMEGFGCTLNEFEIRRLK